MGNSDISSEENKKNRYYDIQYFINDLIEKKYIDLETCDSETVDFINYVVPKEFRGKEALKQNKEYLIPEQIIAYKYFDNLKNNDVIEEKSDKVEENNEYYTGYPFKVHMDVSDIEKISDVRTIEGEVLHKKKEKTSSSRILTPNKKSEDKKSEVTISSILESLTDTPKSIKESIKITSLKKDKKVVADEDVSSILESLTDTSIHEGKENKIIHSDTDVNTIQ